MATGHFSTGFQLTVALWCMVQLWACNSKDVTDRETIVHTLQQQMQEQQDAWNRADIDVFMKHYWHSDSLMFIGKSGITRGWQATLDNYKKGYPDATAMGTLKFDNRFMEVQSDTSAFVIGKWTLFRTADTLSGHYSLLWKKKADHWVIVADHSS
ncbi:MAG: nuclear transport factor 2 family protein [Flavobacteriales bacterium]|nr:nuclear transport factor 2 family protein [Flavobacteriales bacterium]